MKRTANPLDEQRALEDESTERLLYNPSPDFVEANYAAHDFLFPPDGPGVHPHTLEQGEFDGVLGVKDVWGNEWSKDEDSGKQKTTGNRVLQLSSVLVINHILKHYASRGIVKLTGDRQKDAVIKREAKKTWTAFQLGWAKNVIAKRDVYLREFHSSPGNSGHVPDPPNDMETRAYKVVADHRLGNIGRLEFVCRHDGFQTDDRDDWSNHLAAFHPNDKGDAPPPADGKGKAKKGKKGQDGEEEGGS